MKSIRARNINEAFHLTLMSLREEGITAQSRNGPVVSFPTPVSIEYTHSDERILFLPERKTNPTFAIVETIWMLAGRNDLSLLTPFNQNMAKYSDDGQTVRGSAYGARWRNWFGRDQLRAVVAELQDPTSRRAVLTMWDAESDLNRNSKDLPCNLQILFRVIDDELCMTVTNRSNDMIYGAFNTNVVHFSILHEVIAGALKLGIGSYWQISNNFHLYTDDPLSKFFFEDYQINLQEDAYGLGVCQSYPLAEEIVNFTKFLEECEFFCDRLGVALARTATHSGEDVSNYLHASTTEITSGFLRECVVPMVRSYVRWKYSSHNANDLEEANVLADSIDAQDLYLTMTDWLSRRKVNG